MKDKETIQKVSVRQKGERGVQSQICLLGV